MANELKPCPFCNSTDVSVNRSEITCMSWVSCTSCGLETPSETGVTDEQAISYWNTRHAPPVEGLDTVGNGVFSKGEMIGFVGLGYEYNPDDTRPREPIVKRSQAEAIIAAERAEKELAQQAEEEAKDLFWSVYGVYLAKGGVPVSTDKARSALSNKIATLEADNEALTARVKELEAERDDWKANHDEMVSQNAVLRQRPDLPVDRIPAIEAYKVKLTSEKAKFEELDKCHERTIDLCNQKSEQIEKLLSEVFHDPALGITWKQICEQFDKECQHHQERAEIAEDRVKHFEDAIKAKGGNEHSPTQDAYDLACKAIDTHRNRAKALETQLAAAKKALEFYADPKNYDDTPPYDGDPGCITPNAIPRYYQEDGAKICDCGDKARAALEGKL